MTQEEWLGDYFGTPFDELQSTIRAYNPSFSTSLGPVDESLYRSWKNQNAPGDTGDTYDYRGAYQAGVTPEQPPMQGHWTDRFKTPSHPTFSVESQYAGAYPERAGSWDGDIYVPPPSFNPAPDEGTMFPTPMERYQGQTAGFPRRIPPPPRMSTWGDYFQRLAMPPDEIDRYNIEQEIMQEERAQQEAEQRRILRPQNRL